MKTVFLQFQLQLDSFRFQEVAECILRVLFDVCVAGKVFFAPAKPLQGGAVFRQVDGTMLQ